jgi:hypothetical protein
MQKLDDRLTTIEQSVGEMKGMKDTIATKADLDALKASIDKLQQDLADLRKNPGAAPAAPHAGKKSRHAKAAPAADPTAALAETDAAAAAPAAPAPAADTPAAAASAPAKTAAHHRKHAHGHRAGAAMASVPGSSHWVLKSAKPGMAWIAEPGSAEIRTVSVGESVKGLGKVTSISQDSGGRWVVSGTRGQINQ